MSLRACLMRLAFPAWSEMSSSRWRLVNWLLQTALPKSGFLMTRTIPELKRLWKLCEMPISKRMTHGFVLVAVKRLKANSRHVGIVEKKDQLHDQGNYRMELESCQTYVQLIAPLASLGP